MSIGDETVGQALGSPVQAGDDDPEPEHGTALCLSGGGYRAMLFHAGVLWRLNDAGLLPSLRRVSSVRAGRSRGRAGPQLGRPRLLR